jgi:NAD(P)H-dependent flavin oxidoreductase YrpB (nitropropane dioxygenase family)
MDDPEIAAVDAGQGVGLLREERPAEQLIHEIGLGAAQLLERWAPG